MDEQTVRESSWLWLSEGPRRTEGWLSATFALAGLVALAIGADGSTQQGALFSVVLSLFLGTLGGVAFARSRAAAIRNNPEAYADAFEKIHALADSSLGDIVKASLQRTTRARSPSLSPRTKVALVLFVVLILLVLGSLPWWIPGAFTPPGTLFLSTSAFYAGSFLDTGRILRNTH